MASYRHIHRHIDRTRTGKRGKHRSNGKERSKLPQPEPTIGKTDISKRKTYRWMQEKEEQELCVGTVFY